MIIFDYVDDGEGAVTRWREGLQKRQQAALDAKIKMLRQYGVNLPPRLLAGPLKGHPHLYKLRIEGDVALRPILCKGHANMETEVTLLFGAMERDRRLVPAGALDEADLRRRRLVAGTARRTLYKAD